MSTFETTEKRSTFMRPNPVLNAKIKWDEWTAAFGLATTVIWIYIKILQLALRILAKSKRN